MNKETEIVTMKAYPEIYKTLMADIGKYKYLLRKNYNQKFLQNLDNAIEDLKKAGYFDQRLRTGDYTPDFTLNACEGHSVCLSEVLTKTPVVLSFFRGR